MYEQRAIPAGTTFHERAVSGVARKRTYGSTSLSATGEGRVSNVNRNSWECQAIAHNACSGLDEELRQECPVEEFYEEEKAGGD